MAAMFLNMPKIAGKKLGVPPRLQKRKSIILDFKPIEQSKFLD